MYSARDTLAGGFPHSDICGSKLVCQLPAAYRRLLRPSSPVIAKASTTCTYSLDPITLPPSARHGHQATALPLFSDVAESSYAITTRYQLLPAHHQCRLETISSSELLKKQPFDQWSNGNPRHGLSFDLCSNSGGGERDRTDDLLLAKQVLSQLSYTPGTSDHVVGLVGFEPTTPALSRRCSNRLSYRPFRNSDSSGPGAARRRCFKNLRHPAPLAAARNQPISVDA